MLVLQRRGQEGKWWASTGGEGFMCIHPSIEEKYSVMEESPSIHEKVHFKSVPQPAITPSALTLSSKDFPSLTPNLDGLKLEYKQGKELTGQEKKKSIVCNFSTSEKS